VQVATGKWSQSTYPWWRPNYAERSGWQTPGVDHFVGRKNELAILDAEMKAVRGGQPRVVLVEAEAGVSAMRSDTMGRNCWLACWLFDQ
jgi:hypothetical protein